MDFQCPEGKRIQSINVLFGNAGFMKSSLHLVPKNGIFLCFPWTLSVPRRKKTRQENKANKPSQQKPTQKKQEQKKKRKENCSTIKAKKFHRTADTITTQKANKVETPRIEFKGLITTNRGAPKQI